MCIRIQLETLYCSLRYSRCCWRICKYRLALKEAFGRYVLVPKGTLQNSSQCVELSQDRVSCLLWGALSLPPKLAIRRNLVALRMCHRFRGSLCFWTLSVCSQLKIRISITTILIKVHWQNTSCFSSWCSCRRILTTSVNFLNGNRLNKMRDF